MVFNENKFEQMSFGITNNVPITQYKTPLGEKIQSKDNIKDQGVIVSKDLNFKEHKQNYDGLHGRHGYVVNNV